MKKLVVIVLVCLGGHSFAQKNHWASISSHSMMFCKWDPSTKDLEQVGPEMQTTTTIELYRDKIILKNQISDVEYNVEKIVSPHHWRLKTPKGRTKHLIWIFKPGFNYVVFYDEEKVTTAWKFFTYNYHQS